VKGGGGSGDQCLLDQSDAILSLQGPREVQRRVPVLVTAGAAAAGKQGRDQIGEGHGRETWFSAVGSAPRLSKIEMTSRNPK
jgi:hypothetical protein